MTTKPSGWFRVDASHWPLIIDRLPRPLTVEEVVTDLRWWDDRKKMNLGSRPGRPSLSERWGWGERKTRNMLASGAWMVGSSEGPAKVQPGSNDDTVEPTLSDEKVQPGSSEGPAPVPVEPIQTTDYQTTEILVTPLDPPTGGSTRQAPSTPIVTPDDRRILRAWNVQRDHAPRSGDSPGRLRSRVAGCIKEVQRLANLQPDPATDILCDIVEWTHTSDESWWRKKHALSAAVVFKRDSIEQRLSLMQGRATEYNDLMEWANEMDEQEAGDAPC